MVPILSLWLPVLLAAVLVFVASSLIHMVLGYHRRDFRKLPAEGEVMQALRGFSIPPGEYLMPYAATRAEMASAEHNENLRQGPVALLTVIPNGPPAMGKSLVLWFVYCMVVGIFAAYLAGRTLGPGSPYLSVFRVTGAVAFVGYALALWQNTIWYKRSWTATAKSTFDGLVYALLTAGAFGWLWPAP